MTRPVPPSASPALAPTPAPAPAQVPAPRAGITAPLRQPLFRRIWLASLLSNLGFMILAVAAGWTMTELTPSAHMVALVQTAIMLPMMLLSLPAGAIADMYDRRKVGLFALCLPLAAACGLCAVMPTGLMTPWLMLGFCFLGGSGMALFGPSWQAAVSEQVPARDLAPAVALNAISFNIARSFGPAIGGLIVAAAGSVTAFGVTALSYIPLMIVMFLWRRVPVPSRLPPERIDRAVHAGIRYVFYSHPLRAVLIRTFAIGITGGSVSALMPLVTRDLVHGQAQTYGLMLGAFGIGSVIGALGIARIRRHLSNEGATAAFTLLTAACMAGVAFSAHVPLTIILLLGAGIGWMVCLTLCNVTVQMAVPRWVTGRAAAAFQTAIAGGIAIGSWLWGQVAQTHGVAAAMLGSAVALVLTLLVAIIWRMPEIAEADRQAIDRDAPEVALALTGRSGPIILEIEYRIDPQDARTFYHRMQAVRAMRLRNGAFDWSISRDIENPEYWFERYFYPTWFDYLRQRSRATPEEEAIHDLAVRHHRGDPVLRVRRLLERPFGSVRWKDDAPDFGSSTDAG